MTNVTRTLKKIIEESFDGNRSSFAMKVGINRSTLSSDLTSQRKIHDDRFATYLAAVTPRERETLVRARLLDIIPQPFHEELIFSKGSQTVQEVKPVFSASIPLTDEQRSALQWLATELTRDSQLIEPVMRICESLGWERPDPKKAHY